MITMHDVIKLLHLVVMTIGCIKKEFNMKESIIEWFQFNINVQFCS